MSTRPLALGLASVALLVSSACGSADSTVTNDNDAGPGGGGADASSGGGGGGGGGGGSGGGGGALADGGGGGGGGDAMGGTCGTCPTGYTCGSANGIPVCRAPSGIPLFDHVFVIVMENTSLSTLSAATNTPNLKALQAAWATGSDYHGITHPSLPNYIAMVSGGAQSIGCDCQPSGAACSGLTCNIFLGSCGCDQPATVKSLGDQLESAGITWKSFAEDLGTPCNLTASGNYVPRHVPMLYFDSIQKTSLCASRIVDFTTFAAASAPRFSFISPNLIDDMHDPFPASAQNLANGDTWIKPVVDGITSSASFASGLTNGLLVIVWDEDDNSGVPAADAPIPIFVLSPLAKHGGFVSSVHADHYALLATIEDGLGLARPRLGSAEQATPLTDYFPAQ